MHVCIYTLNSVVLWSPDLFRLLPKRKILARVRVKETGIVRTCITENMIQKICVGLVWNKNIVRLSQTHYHITCAGESTHARILPTTTSKNCLISAHMHVFRGKFIIFGTLESKVWIAIVEVVVLFLPLSILVFLLERHLYLRHLWKSPHK